VLTTEFVKLILLVVFMQQDANSKNNEELKVYATSTLVLCLNWMAEESGFNFWQKQDIFFFTTTSKMVRCPPPPLLQSPFHWVSPKYYYTSLPDMTRSELDSYGTKPAL
jgi:hypothetical protein